jgi:chromosome partitioning protein
MSVIAVISTKGGAGKTTVSVHLCVAAHGLGRKVLLLDADEAQRSAYIWAETVREHDRIATILVNYDTAADQIRKAKASGYDFVVVDVPAGGGRVVSHVASLADQIIVPVMPGAFDLAAMHYTLGLLRDTADNSRPGRGHNALAKAAIVINRAPTTASSSWMADLEGALAECGAGSLQRLAVLGDRTIYNDALEDGYGVTELKKNTKASDEIRRLYDGVAALESQHAGHKQPKERRS